MSCSPAVSRISAIITAALCLSVTSAKVDAQQFGTDDAGMVERGACQLEAWRGERQTRIEPACQLVPNVEITLGMELDARAAAVEEYTLEMKTVFRAPEPGRLGVSLVGGVDFAGRSATEDELLTGAFLYVPATLSIGDDRLLLHGNLGWQTAPGNSGEGSLIWGARGDLELPWADERLVAIAELFAGEGGGAEYQVGLRTRLVPDRFLLDLSWGGHTELPGNRRGWVLGIGWTPAPFR